MNTLLLTGAGVVLFAASALAQDMGQAIELFNSKKYDEAEKMLRTTIEAEPQNGKALAYLGQTLIHKGKTGEAAEYLIKADQLDPSEQSKLGMARVHMERREYDKAEEAINQAREMNNESKELPFYSGMLRASRQQWQEAASDLETAVERDPENAHAHYYAGIAYNSLKKPDKALQHFQQFLKMAPNAPEAKKVQAIVKSTR